MIHQRPLVGRGRREQPIRRARIARRRRVVICVCHQTLRSLVVKARVRPRPAAVAAVRAPAADPAAPLWRADSAPGAAGHGRGCVGVAARVGVLLQRPLQRLAAEALRLERRVEAGPGRVEEEAQVEPRDARHQRHDQQRQLHRCAQHDVAKHVVANHRLATGAGQQLHRPCAKHPLPARRCELVGVCKGVGARARAKVARGQQRHPVRGRQGGARVRHRRRLGRKTRADEDARRERVRVLAAARGAAVAEARHTAHGQQREQRERRRRVQGEQQ
mmetsp:Transcript_20187/g.57812  ORF Transcript_20187/g.57812 Transcript_20187/m.57812 type:complete len:275 (-) Transcript_20187:2402-3226(-)